MSETYKVLSPWGEFDPFPVQGIAPRIDTLEGKTIGIYILFKDAAHKIAHTLEDRLGKLYPTAKFSEWLNDNMGKNDFASKKKDAFMAWAKSCDAVILTTAD